MEAKRDSNEAEMRSTVCAIPSEFEKNHLKSKTVDRYRDS
jgi:hypothetical protein